VRAPIKICCIQDENEAKLAIDCGAEALGLVSEMPSGWGPIPEEVIGRIAKTIPPFVTSVLLTSKTNARDIIEQQQVTQCNAIQIVDAFPISEYALLRQAMPGISILQAVHVYGTESIDHAKAVAPHVDGLILDTGSPHGADVRVLGGTGQTHDWTISAAIVQAVSTPVFLAGGLKTHNIAEAMQTTKSYGIDLCTGVRTNTHLDPDKLRAFMTAARQATQGEV